MTKDNIVDVVRIVGEQIEGFFSMVRENKNDSRFFPAAINLEKKKMLRQLHQFRYSLLKSTTHKPIALLLV